MTTTVGIAVAKKGDVHIFLNGLGTVTPPATVMVKTQVSGQLIRIAFTEGQQVKKGDFLAQIIRGPSRLFWTSKRDNWNEIVRCFKMRGSIWLAIRS
jgi:hypothetical protein